LGYKGFLSIVNQFSDEPTGKSAAETQFLNEAEALEQIIETIENKSGPISDQERQYIEEMTDYIGRVLRNDFGDPVYKGLRQTILPVQIADMWEMAPKVEGIGLISAPDRDWKEIRPWLGYKYNIADMTKLQKANVVTNKSVNNLETRIETLDRANRYHNLPKELIDENNKAIKDLWAEIDRQNKSPDKTERLTIEQLEAMDRVSPALFSLYIGGKFDIFLRERSRIIREQ
jgi:polyhydroxyalkanoate synthesis regulator phasin